MRLIVYAKMSCNKLKIKLLLCSNEQDEKYLGPGFQNPSVPTRGVGVGYYGWIAIICWYELQVIRVWSSMTALIDVFRDQGPQVLGK